MTTNSLTSAPSLIYTAGLDFAMYTEMPSQEPAGIEELEVEEPLVAGATSMDSYLSYTKKVCIASSTALVCSVAMLASCASECWVQGDKGKCFCAGWFQGLTITTIAVSSITTLVTSAVLCLQRN